MSRLSKDEIEQMMSESERWRQANKKHRGKMTARNTLESYILTIQSEIENVEIRQKRRRSKAKVYLGWARRGLSGWTTSECSKSRRVCVALLWKLRNTVRECRNFKERTANVQSEWFIATVSSKALSNKARKPVYLVVSTQPQPYLREASCLFALQWLHTWA